MLYNKILMEAQNSTTTNAQTVSRDYSATSAMPVWDAIKSNLSTIVAICAIVGLFYVLFYRVELLEGVQANQDTQQLAIETNQREILTRLAVMETKQDRNAEDIKEILQAIKELK